MVWFARRLTWSSTVRLIPLLSLSSADSAGNLSARRSATADVRSEMGLSFTRFPVTVK